MNGTPSIVQIIAFLLFLPLIYLRLTVLSDSRFIKKNIGRFIILRNLEKVYRPYLIRYFKFYNALNPKDKLLFEKRVQKFIDMKQFIPRGGIKVITPEMKVMVAGSAIQLTFGYPGVYFRHFWRILIYPDNYYSSITHMYHKGEVNIGGLIVISWESFMEGFRDPDDGTNLGFHEMAHALRLINIVQNEEYDFYDREIMKQFEDEAHNETLKILNAPAGTSLFRDYSVTNADEFFSVAVENFFERPEDFRRHNLKLYTLLTRILKLDPAALYVASKSEKMVS